MSQPATLHYANRHGSAIVYAVCDRTGDQSDDVFDNGLPSSGKRALAQLTSVCTCGASFHDLASEEYD